MFNFLSIELSILFPLLSSTWICLVLFLRTSFFGLRNTVFHLEAIVILSIPKFVVLIVIKNVDLLFILTVQLTITEINKLYWILNIGWGGILSSQEMYFREICLQVPLAVRQFPFSSSFFFSWS